MSNHEKQLFQTELEKFRPYQTRLVQATHKQKALMNELTKIYGDLLQDKRVRAEQAKYESFTRQRNLVHTRYKKIFQSFKDLIAGLMRAQSFYLEMKETVESLEKNVKTFVENRKAEGAQLIAQIQQDSASGPGGQADRERDRLRELMERMSVDPSSNSLIKSPVQRQNMAPESPQPNQLYGRSPPISPPAQSTFASNSTFNHPQPSPNSVSAGMGFSNRPSSNGQFQDAGRRSSFQSSWAVGEPYNPMAYPYQTPTSPPPANDSYPGGAQSYPHYAQNSHNLPQNYVPPPPPPGPPPSSQTHLATTNSNHPHPAGPGGYAHHQPSRQSSGGPSHNQNDPWSGLDAWK